MSRRKHRAVAITTRGGRVVTGGEPVALQALRAPGAASLPDSQALEIASALRLFTDELAGIRRDQGQLAEELRRLRQWTAEREQAEARWQTERERVIQEWFDKADAVSPERRAKRQATLAQETAAAIATAKVKAAQENASLRQRLAAEPKVTVRRPGRVEMIRKGESIVPRLVPDVIRIGHIAFVIPTDRAVDVPQSVAEAIRHSDEDSALLAERQSLLEANLEYGRLRRAWDELDARYQTATADGVTEQPGLPALPEESSIAQAQEG